MKIKKYLHSCLLIEENGKRLLIDPGKFSFGDEGIKAEEVGAVDAILITHEHQDHYFPEALRAFKNLGDCEIITHAAIGKLLDEEGIAHTLLQDGEEREVVGFHVKGFARSHGPLPLPVPDNFAYLINSRLLHPGDSYEASDISCEVLALPVVAPWAKLTETVEYAKAVGAKTVIPIHDAFLKDFMRHGVYYNVAKMKLEEQHIAFQVLESGDEFEI
ncbi:MAG: MBL fold metallo-hydrolase [Candidatus Nomurabacteria bacterium]|nr:MAG: MBL fold metallo-hydrolase [Candidatus Nomurabacteria bacterium]